MSVQHTLLQLILLTVNQSEILNQTKMYTYNSKSPTMVRLNVSKQAVDKLMNYTFNLVTVGPYDFRAVRSYED